MKCVKRYVGPQKILTYMYFDDENPDDTAKTEYLSEDFTFNDLIRKFQENRKTDEILNRKHLIGLGLQDQEGFLSRAGLLFMDTNPTEFPSVCLRKWSGLNKNSSDIIDTTEYRMNIIRQLEESETYIKNNCEANSYSDLAIKDIIINALANRDYYKLYNEKIYIDIFPNRIEVSSPGEFLSNDNAQDYDSIDMIFVTKRNKAICLTFEVLKYKMVAEWGFEKIVEDYKDYDKSMQPRAYSDKNWFTITLMNKNCEKNMVK